jgi:hypothetical protein
MSISGGSVRFPMKYASTVHPAAARKPANCPTGTDIARIWLPSWQNAAIPAQWLQADSKPTFFKMIPLRLAKP